MSSLYSFSLLLLLSLFSLASSQTTCDQPLDTCDPGIERFPKESRITIKYANKTITNVVYNKNFVDVDVQTDTQGFKYRFVVCGCKIDSGGARQVVFINPLSIYIAEAPALALYSTLVKDNTATLKAVSQRSSIFDRGIRDLVNNGKAVEVSKDFVTDYTKLEQQNIGLSIIGTFGIEDYRQNVTDIPFLVAAENQEADPLARAEWIKLVGLVLNRAEEANKQFEGIEERYKEAKEKAAVALRRRSVFFNYPLALMEKASWTQPVKDEYIVRLVDDANADYRYSDKEPEADTTGTGVNVSTIVQDFGSADVLLQSFLFPFESNPTLKLYLDRFEKDFGREEREKVEKLKAVRCGEVWDQNNRISDDNSATDFLEGAIIRPDDVLLDFVQVLHGDVDLGDRAIFYLRKYGETDDTAKTCPFRVLNEPAPEGQVFVDKKFQVPELDRFQVEDRLEDKVIPAIKERVDDPFEVFFHREDASEDQTVVTVRVQVDDDDEDSAKNETSIFFGMREGLGDGVRARDEDGNLLDLPTEEGGGEDGGGLSGGAIAGIVIAVLAVVGVIGFVLLRKKKSSPQYPVAGMANDGDNWAEL